MKKISGCGSTQNVTSLTTLGLNSKLPTMAMNPYEPRRHDGGKSMVKRKKERQKITKHKLYNRKKFRQKKKNKMRKKY